jgi:hypothetical protein
MSGNMANDVKGKCRNGITHSLILYGFAIPVLFLVSNVSASIIQVDDYTITQGDDFFINVTCIPDAALKGWEFRLHYDTTLLLLLDITEGDFFDGYLTFPVMKEDATYSLIVGKGNVTTQGVLASFLFRAVQPGQSPVQVSGAGVCNETRYLPLTVINGSVTVTELRVEETIRRGWNRFPDGSLTIQGYSTFGSDVTRTQGWSTFRCEKTGQDGFWELLTAISAAALVIIRRIKK